MKERYIALLALLTLMPALQADPISIEEFGKLSLSDQVKAIEQAPQEMRESLEKIHHHKALVQEYGGEDAVKREKETCVLAARGLVSLLRVFVVHSQVWSDYAGAVLLIDKEAGMTPEKLASVAINLTKEQDVVNKREDAVRSLVFNLAASSEALALAKKANDLYEQMEERLGFRGKTPYRSITKDERVEVDRKVDEILEELKKLPTLPPQEVQREYDAFPEEEIPHPRHGG